MGPRQVRPLAIGEIVDAALRVVREHTRALVLVAVAVTLPFELAQDALRTFALPSGVRLLSVDGSLEIEGDWRAWTVAGGATVLLSVLGSLLAFAACCYVAQLGYVDEERVAPREALRATARRLHSLLWVGARLLLVLVILVPVAAIAMVASAFVLTPLIPFAAVWLLLQYLLLVPVLFVEDIRGRRGVRRVRWLLGGRNLAAVVAFLVAAVPIVLLDVVAAVVLFGVDRVSGEHSLLGFASGLVLGLVNAAVAAPIAAATAAVLYTDCRVRREGLDVELAAERLGLEPRRRLVRPAPPATPFEYARGTTPPYWPPPPGWKPSEPAVPLRPRPANPNLPPYWPPPPGWQPPSTAQEP